MIHDDEVRTAEELEQLRARATPADPAAFSDDERRQDHGLTAERPIIAGSAAPHSADVLMVADMAGAAPTPLSPAAAWEPSMPAEEHDLETLHREFATRPSPTSFYRLVHDAWSTHGQLDEPARLIFEHPGFMDGLTVAQGILVDRILGDHRLRHAIPQVPARAEGTAFIAEPGRVMYCVQSTPVYDSDEDATHTRGVADGFRQADVDVRVVARAGYPWEHRDAAPMLPIARTVQSLDGLAYVHLPGSTVDQLPMDHYLLEAADAFTREALLQRPEVIQAASDCRTGLPALIASRRLGVPFVYEVRGFSELSRAAQHPAWDRSEQFRTIAALETLVAKEADHVLANTRQVKDVLVARGIPATKIAIAPHAVDDDLPRNEGQTARPRTHNGQHCQTVARAWRRAHAVACEHFAAHVDPDARDLSGITVGLIADEFTTTTLSASLDIVVLDRSEWKHQLTSQHVDIVLIESAWDGNDGQWRRGVGLHDPHEHEDIRDLLAYCRDAGITTAFWNKEDPVHFKRFRPTAALCDHVFTTDGAMIPQYLSTPGAVTQTASSMPFYAQPLIHNPLPTERAYRHTVAYAGTYYGDRYKERSAELRRMLETASAFGLTIYDRQAALPDSPYRLPAEFARFSSGALPYEQVIDTYKSHLAHLNVNSVTNSPTMFSRRVVEIAACGGIALSGPGRGVEESFAGMIPVSADPSTWRALLHDWSTDPTARVREAWRQLRVVHRSHTLHTALTIMLRTAGIPVQAPELDDYAVVLTALTPELVDSVLAQSRRPREVFVPAGPSELTGPLHAAGMTVRDPADVHRAESHWIGLMTHPVHRTWFEDLLLATRFGSWDRIDADFAQDDSVGRTLASYGVREGSTAGLVLSAHARCSGTVEGALRSGSHSAVTFLVVPAHTGAT